MPPPLPARVVDRFPPEFNFGDKPHPDPPDYTNIDHWCAHPDKADDCGANDVVAADESAAESGIVETLLPRHERPCDCFYVMGSVLWANKQTWNAAVPDAECDKNANRSVTESASALNNRCRVWAPRYRGNAPPCHNEMMHPDHSTEWQRAAYGSMELAFSDVERAFELFVTEVTRRRGARSPIIVASHSQGSHHATRLLEKFEADANLRSRLVCAYILGPCGAFTYAKFKRCFPSLKPCSGPLDSHCVVAFDNPSEKQAWVVKLQDVEPGGVLEDDTFPMRNFSHTSHVPHNVRYPEGGGKWESATGETMFCTNPLTWTSWVGESAEGGTGATETCEMLAAAYRGRCIASMTQDDDKASAGPVVSLRKDVATVGKYWAEIRFRGGALVSNQLEGEEPYGHQEWGRWWFNIRENVAARVDHFLSKISGKM